MFWFYTDWTSSGNMFISESRIVARGMMVGLMHVKLFFFFFKQYCSFSVSGLFYFHRIVMNHVKWALIVYAGD